MPTINILFHFVDGPWGGGNQFLKGLKLAFEEMKVYAKLPEEADIILFNSYPFRHEELFDRIYELRKSNKTVIHRLAQPLFLARGKDRLLDKIIYSFNKRFTDGTIFQSNWDREVNMRHGFRGERPEAVVLNAPDPSIFYPASREKPSNEKVRLISTNWSSNPRKGFAIYKFLDENLDFERYEFSIYGNSKTQFNNIRVMAPVKSSELAEKLRASDIFMTASMNEACSNSLVEALHCGLPAVAISSGGNPELVGKGGVMFHGRDDVLSAIDLAASHIDRLREEIALPSISHVARAYYDFCAEVHAATSGRKRSGNSGDLLWIKFLVRLNSAREKVNAKWKRVVA